MKTVSTLCTAAAAAALFAGAATAQTTLRIQTHQSPESASGKEVARFVEQVETMSGGSLDIEMFYSSSIVGSAETFDAAASGIIDCDMTNGSYQTGKDAAFQFVADPMGGYDEPLQMLAWIMYGGGREAINELYNDYDMEFVGGYLGGAESLVSTAPLAGIDDLQDWKFRSPPGMETEIFAELGASPIVMDFTEIFTALETGIIDGADASTLANNVGLGLYDITKHTNYPGFHSMATDHLACNKAVWDSLTDAQREILYVAMDSTALRLMTRVLVENGEALATLPSEKGVTIHAWSDEDVKAFREGAIATWQTWADKSPAAANMVESHSAFVARIGLAD